MDEGLWIRVYGLGFMDEGLWIRDGYLLQEERELDVRVSSALHGEGRAHLCTSPTCESVPLIRSSEGPPYVWFRMYGHLCTTRK